MPENQALPASLNPTLSRREKEQGFSSPLSVCLL